MLRQEKRPVHWNKLQTKDTCKNITHTSQAIKFEKNYNIDGSLLSTKAVVAENGYENFHDLKNCAAISM